MSEGNMLLEDTVLYNFLEADGIAELKSKVIDMIVKEIREQLEQSSYYIISPDDICNDLYEDIIKEVIKEVKEEYKKAIMDRFDKLV